MYKNVTVIEIDSMLGKMKKCGFLPVSSVTVLDHEC